MKNVIDFAYPQRILAHLLLWNDSIVRPKRCSCILNSLEYGTDILGRMGRAQEKSTSNCRLCRWEITQCHAQVDCLSRCYYSGEREQAGAHSLTFLTMTPPQEWAMKKHGPGYSWMKTSGVVRRPYKGAKGVHCLTSWQYQPIRRGHRHGKQSTRQTCWQTHRHCI